VLCVLGWGGFVLCGMVGGGGGFCGVGVFVCGVWGGGVLHRVPEYQNLGPF